MQTFGPPASIVTHAFEARNSHDCRQNARHSPKVSIKRTPMNFKIHLLVSAYRTANPKERYAVTEDMREGSTRIRRKGQW